MKKNYPDVSELFKMKAEWRQRQVSRPLTEKLETANRLRQLAQEIPKLSKPQTSKTRATKASK